jgi:hypothetical protein
MLGRLLPDSESMVMRTLRGTEWSQLGDYVSPSFFEVLPARALWAQLRELGGNARDGRGFAVAGRAVEAHLASIDCPVRVGAEAEGAAPGLDVLDQTARHDRGQRVLEVYFAQLAGAPATILDLRASRFEGGGDDLRWRPRPLWIRWDDDFLEGLRDLYAGFYEGDDARFQGALAGLGLSAAEDVFREHFGGDDQSAVRFEAAKFQATFHEAFVRCRDEGVRLHRNFLALGIYLGCLYDHLEALGLAFDVRAAWQRAAAAR